MKATPEKGSFYSCTYCDRATDMCDWDEMYLYAHSEYDITSYDGIDYDYLFDASCTEILIYVCPNCEVSSESVEAESEVWKCNDCGDAYVNKETADECC